MSEILREQAQWRNGKTPIIGKYIGEHKKLFDEIAGRGFLNLPGYAYDAENQLELAAKMGLSELNYKIMHETIERELKQAGIDFNVEYAEAAMAWELEKQGLLSAWDHELAGIKQGMATEEEVLARLALEVDARQVVLIAAKSAIDLEMEGYRKALADLDAATAPYEVQLANAKVLTAQKKLEVIPILQEIISKERELLVLEQGKAIEYTALMNVERQIADKQGEIIPTLQTIISKEQELLALEAGKAAEYTTLVGVEGQIADKQGEIITALENVIAKEYELLPFEEQKAQEYRNLLQVKQENAIKKQLLVPWYLELANLNETYAFLIPGQIAIEEQIADEKVAQANALIEKEENKLSELNINIDTAEKEVEISAAKRALQVEQFDNQQTLVGKELTNENAYQNEIAAKHGVLLSEERDTLTYVLDKKGETNDIQNDTKLSSVQATTEAQIAAGNSSAAASAYAERKSSEIRAATEITAALTHLIG